MLSGPAMDMFSFGFVLLSSIDTSRYFQWLIDFRKLPEGGKEGSLTIDKYTDLLSKLRRELLEKGKADDRYLLIHDLLSPIPGERPTAEQAEKRLQELLY